jgi:PadR family transcriptional regulator, regulatory protein AphA
MEYQIVSLENRNLLECQPDGGVIIDEPAVLDLIGLCGEEEIDAVLLYDSNLPVEFFDLKSGLAGKVLLKLSNYSVRAAVVASPERIGHGRLYEFVLETNRGKEFGVLSNREDALNWMKRS